ncbi:hypothetical protein LIER_04914 [Lithospermum erythrorhizon]|uniref:Reverse transcriptase/retrotransposon-derived protein RNase H-like domain-containing protein n=1 Tax=Lithospermum erythrorhizon TaxID=34254 RepID=A0AAV3NYS7_LITER
MKKGAPFTWDASCSTTFQDIKAYLISPPVLAAPMQGKPLILYIAAQEQSVGALLAQENDEEAEALFLGSYGKLDLKSESDQIHHPLPAEWELCDELPDEDVMNVEVLPPWQM